MGSSSFDIAGTWVHSCAEFSFQPDGHFVLEKPGGEIYRGTYSIVDKLPYRSLDPYASPTGLYLVFEYDWGEADVLQVPEVHLVTGVADDELWLQPANRLWLRDDPPEAPELLRRVATAGA